MGPDNAVLPHAAILHPEKIQRAKRYWLKTIQSCTDMFPNEISALTRQYPLPKDSPLRAPYFAEDGFIRIRRDFNELVFQKRQKIPSSYALIRC